MEWLFLTCHNHWIVCRLVRDDEHPFLAYSPMISIEDSSVPFRAFLGAILSIVKDVRVEPSEFNPEMQLDTIIEDTDEGPLPEDDIDDGSGAYPGSSSRGISTDPPMTRGCARAGHENAQSGLTVCPSLSLFVTWLTHVLSGYFVHPKLSRILPSLGLSPSLFEQHARPSAVRQERETTSMADPLYRVRVDWQRLAMSFR
jgi:hypothetical protein